MKQTMTLKLYELLDKMRNMKEGEEIGLCLTADGAGDFGIRCLPNRLFCNGMCWIADSFGGGATVAFSEPADVLADHPEQLEDDVTDWLIGHALLNGNGTVYVRLKDRTKPETRWEFKETTIQPKNSLVCMKFAMTRLCSVYISIPPDMPAEDACELTRKELSGLDRETFNRLVTTSDEEVWDPWPEDFIDMYIDPYCNQSNADMTDHPTGTLGK